MGRINRSDSCELGVENTLIGIKQEILTSQRPNIGSRLERTAEPQFGGGFKSAELGSARRR
jgi:hypothetical protein